MAERGSSRGSGNCARQVPANHIPIRNITAAYLILRKDGSLLISLLAMMLSTGMPELQAEADLEFMRTQLQLDQSSEEQVLKFLSFIFLYFYIFIFIGPESDHWECLSLTHSLPNSLLFSKLD